MRKKLFAYSLLLPLVSGWTGCAGFKAVTRPTPAPREVTVLSGSARGGDAIFALAQPWQQTVDDGFRPGRVHLRWTPEALVVEAEMIDDEVFTISTADNQRMWQLGDVFEIFLQKEGRSDYVELHLSPNGHRLHLRLPNPQRRLSPDGPELTIEEMTVVPPRFRGFASRTANGWRARVEIPPEALVLARFETGQSFRIGFGRYDAASGREAVLSTTADHEVLSFHRPQDWTRIRL
jgi:hypothetical protein